MPVPMTNIWRMILSETYFEGKFTSQQKNRVKVLADPQGTLVWGSGDPISNALNLIFPIFDSSDVCYNNLCIATTKHAFVRKDNTLQRMSSASFKHIQSRPLHRPDCVPEGNPKLPILLPPLTPSSPHAGQNPQSGYAKASS
jgi:hypothetical protein